MPSGIGVHGDDDHVAQDAGGLFVVPAHELVDGLDQLVRADHFGGVQAAVDPDHRLAFLGQRARLLVGHAAGAVQLLRDLLVAIELAKFSGAVMIAARCGRPSSVLPISTTCIRLDSLSIFCQ